MEERKARKGSSRRIATYRKFILLAAVVASLAFAAAYYALRVVHDPDEHFYSSAYSAFVDSDSNDPYTVEVPIPGTRAGEPPPGFAEDAQSSAYAEFELVNTPHGPALRIIAHGNIWVNWSLYYQTNEPDPISCWNMTMKEDNEVWMSSDDANLTIHIEYHWGVRWYPSPTFVSGTTHYYKAVMEEGAIGWRLVECEDEGIILN